MGGVGLTIGSGKGWEGYRAYERRLVAIAGRDKGVKEASKKVAAGGVKGRKSKGKQVEEEEEEEDEERERTESPSPGSEVGGSPTPVRTTPRGLKRAAPPTEEEDEEEAIIDKEAEDDDDVDMENQVEPEEIVLDLGQDTDFAGADFTDLNSSQGGPGMASQPDGRERSVSVEPVVRATGAKRRKVGPRVI